MLWTLISYIFWFNVHLQGEDLSRESTSQFVTANLPPQTPSPENCGAMVNTSTSLNQIVQSPPPPPHVKKSSDRKPILKSSRLTILSPSAFASPHLSGHGHLPERGSWRTSTPLEGAKTQGIDFGKPLGRQASFINAMVGAEETEENVDAYESCMEERSTSKKNMVTFNSSVEEFSASSLAIGGSVGSEKKGKAADLAWPESPVKGTSGDIYCDDDELFSPHMQLVGVSPRMELEEKNSAEVTTQTEESSFFSGSESLKNGIHRKGEESNYEYESRDQGQGSGKSFQGRSCGNSEVRANETDTVDANFVTGQPELLNGEQQEEGNVNSEPGHLWEDREEQQRWEEGMERAETAAGLIEEESEISKILCLRKCTLSTQSEVEDEEICFESFRPTVKDGGHGDVGELGQQEVVDVGQLQHSSSGQEGKSEVEETDIFQSYTAHMQGKEGRNGEEKLTNEASDDLGGGLEQSIPIGSKPSGQDVEDDLFQSYPATVLEGTAEHSAEGKDDQTEGHGEGVFWAAGDPCVARWEEEQDGDGLWYRAQVGQDDLSFFLQ